MKIECPINGGPAEKCVWKPRIGQVRDFPNVGVIQCQECQLVTHEQDLSNDVNYESGSMHNWAQGYGDSLPGPEADTLRRINAIKKLASKRKIHSILDFGCGSGGMISAFASDFKVIGIEPDSGARHAAKDLGHTVFESAEVAEFNNVQVDLVTLFHVIEHFYEAAAELHRILELLRPGGFLIIETPNSMDALLSKYESKEFSKFTYWSHHPMLHSHKSLEILVKRCGFEIIENSGVQRYDINNHLYWLSEGRPGGHEKWQYFAPEELIETYARFLVESKISDTLWVVARKPNISDPLMTDRKSL
jgi:2-polyprenyl-3-methyl-5-hydroxy-6-metoxy-1,4-benzoquinol methylase